MVQIKCQLAFLAVVKLVVGNDDDGDVVLVFPCPLFCRAALPLDAGDCPCYCCSCRLLKLLLLTWQSAEHGAVEPKQNELPSFRERRGLSIVPIKSPTGPRLLLDSTALHALLDAGLHLILN